MPHSPLVCIEIKTGTNLQGQTGQNVIFQPYITVNTVADIAVEVVVHHKVRVVYPCRCLIAYRSVLRNVGHARTPLLAERCKAHVTRHLQEDSHYIVCVFGTCTRPVVTVAMHIVHSDIGTQLWCNLITGRQAYGVSLHSGIRHDAFLLIIGISQPEIELVVRVAQRNRVRQIITSLKEIGKLVSMRDKRSGYPVSVGIERRVELRYQLTVERRTPV